MPNHKLVIEFLPIAISLGIAYVSRCVLLSLALWLMLKAQDLPYTIFWTIASAACASLFDMIPIVGHPMAAAVLLLCVLKLTRAHLVDVRFTVGISYAVTFLLQMLVLSVLPTPAMVRARTLKPAQTPQTLQAAMKQAAAADDETQADEDEMELAASNSNATAKSMPMASPVVLTNSTATADDHLLADTSLSAAAKEVAKDLKLKGVVHNARESMIMLGTGGKTYTIGLGETVNLKTSSGTVDLKVEKVTANSAVIDVGGIRADLVLK